MGSESREGSTGGVVFVYHIPVHLARTGYGTEYTGAVAFATRGTYSQYCTVPLLTTINNRHDVDLRNHENSKLCS